MSIRAFARLDRHRDRWTGVGLGALAPIGPARALPNIHFCSQSFPQRHRHGITGYSGFISTRLIPIPVEVSSFSMAASRYDVGAFPLPWGEGGAQRRVRGYGFNFRHLTPSPQPSPHGRGRSSLSRLETVIAGNRRMSFSHRDWY